MSKCRHALRLLIAVLCIAGTAAAAFFACDGFFPKQAWTSGTALPKEMDGVCFAVESVSQHAGQFTVRIPDHDQPLTLLVSQATPFMLYIDDDLVYAYHENQVYQRLHLIELPDSAADVRIDLLDGTFIRLLLGQQDTMQHMVEQAARINYISIGMQGIVVVYALSLYLSKRSEGYLLSLAVLTLGNLLLTSICGMQPSFVTERAFRLVQTPLVMLLRVLTVCCCFLILPEPALRLRKRNLLLLAAIIYAALLLCHFGGLSSATRIAIDVLPILGILLLLRGYMQRMPCTLLSLLGMAVMTGINQYYQVYTTQRANVSGAMPAFLYVWQFGCLCFIFFLMLATNRRFGEKFQDSELLSLVLQKTNQELDQRVKARTQELEDANAQIREEQRQRSQTMLNLLHDLRTPIFSAVGCAEMLQAAQDQETLDILTQRLSDLSHLAEDLFLVAKLQESKITFVLSEEHLAPIIEEIAAEAAIHAADKQIYLHSAITGDPVITADPFRLRQALNNLVDNAFRYMPEGGTLSITMEETPGEARICITDTGKGIKEEDLPHVFDRYYHDGSKHSTGLGLTIAHEIITAMQGSLEVQSVLGKGSTFIIRFPRVKISA